MKLLSLAIPRPLDGLFTYRLPDEMVSQVHVGGWVRVPFGRVTTHAYVVESPREADESSLPEGLKLEDLKDVIEVGTQGVVVPEDVMKLCRWAQDYYAAPLGDILGGAVPAAALGLKNAKPPRTIEQHQSEEFAHELTEDQRKAVEFLDELRKNPQSPTRTALLDGVTGSGKTEVYITLARRVLAEGKGVILLVPEIALTSQLHQRFEKGLGCSVGLWHSAMADGKRRDMFAALLSGDLKVVVGARSAIFAPVKNLGLIVVDEEHDPTYKQEDRVRYNARDLAVVRATQGGGLALLGSATPSLETAERAREGRYACVQLPQRIGTFGLPSIELVDLAESELVPDTQAVLATKTIDTIRETLAAGDQVMVFLNRRGFASFLLCTDCNHVEDCPNCSISLTVHKKRVSLNCHVCGHQARIPESCPKCHGLNLQAVGAGTESLEEELPKLVPEMKPLRLDRDQITSTARLEAVLEEFRAGGANTMLGTQMLVKGHDFPNVTLVVVILADALFRWPDFRAPERALQVLKQVSGRAGRGSRPGRVLIQTYDPEHAVLKVLTGALSEKEFLDGERELRQALAYPPYGRLARLRFESAELNDAKGLATEVAAYIASGGGSATGAVDVLGPSEAFLERAKGIYRWDLLLKAREVRPLQATLWRVRELIRHRQRAAKLNAHILVDVDPMST